MKKFKSAVILAGGKSVRMGFDKQFLKVNGRRLIDKLILNLYEEFEEIIVVSNTLEDYNGSGFILVRDEILNMGPLGGIHAGLKRASSKYVYFIACDMPNINSEYIRFMKNEIKNISIDACITKVGDRIEPFNAFYSKNVLKDIESDLINGKGSVSYFLEKLNCFFIEEKEARKFSPDWSMFLNLNTREELTDYLNNLNI